MQCRLTTTLLSHLARSIDLGKPIWSLLIINEYLAPSDPLHQAFVSKVRRAIEASATYLTALPFLDAVLAGSTLNQLDSKSLNVVRALTAIEAATSKPNTAARYLPSRARAPYTELRQQRAQLCGRPLAIQPQLASNL